MALYRYALLHFPLKITDQMTKVKYSIIICIWTVIIGFWLIYYAIHYDDKICTYDDTLGLKISAVVIFYLTPLILILSSNILTIIELRKRNRIKVAKGLGAKPLATITRRPLTKTELTVMPNSDNNDNLGVNSKKENYQNIPRRSFFKSLKPYICLLLVSISMLVCFTPYTILALNQNWSELVIYKISYACVYLIGVLNPIFIIAFQDSFTVIFKSLFCRKK